MTGENRWKERGEAFRRSSTAMAIPTIFLGSVFGVGALGFFGAGWLGWNQAIGALTGAAVGFGIAIYEMIRIVRQLDRETKDE